MKSVNNLKTEFAGTKTALGFWIYLMTDLLLFASLFATFIVLRGSPSDEMKEIFNLPFIYIETIVLLTSSYTAGMGVYYAMKGNSHRSLILLGITFILGLVFLSMEITEFSLLAKEGHSWASNGYMSAYFTLVGTHGFHIFIGLIWLLFLMQKMAYKKISNILLKRLFLWGLFWHFLDIVWIFIFSIVYLTGAV